MSSCDINQLFDQVAANILAKDDTPFDAIFEQLARLKALANVQKVLLSTAQSLSNHPRDRALPNQLATRVKAIVKFAYGDPRHTGNLQRAETRSARLRKVDCNAFKFCGLAFKVRELLELSDLEFELLLQHVTEFVRSRGLVEQLYRKDISNALNSGIVLGDGQRVQEFREFLLASVNARPLTGSLESVKDDEHTSTKIIAKEPPVSVVEDPYDLMSSQTRPNKRRNIELDFQSPEWTLGSEVFVLTIDNVKDIVQSNQIGSDIRLTWPHYLQTPPFVTIPISNTLALKYMTLNMS